MKAMTFFMLMRFPAEHKHPDPSSKADGPAQKNHECTGSRLMGWMHNCAKTLVISSATAHSYRFSFESRHAFEHIGKVVQ